jgi:putative ABC transport system permease protein
VRFLNLIAKNALRNMRRTLLTVLSVAVSLFMFCTLLAVRTELDQEDESDIGHLRLVVRRATSLADALPESYRQKLEGVPGVVMVHPMNWFGGIYQDRKSVFANIATDARTLLPMFPEYRVPPEQAEVFVRERTAALAGRQLADRFGWTLGDRITLLGTIYPVDLQMTIRAMYTGGDEDILFFHQEYLDEALGRPGTVRTFRLKAESAAAVPRIMATLDEMFRNTAAETKTETERAFQLSFIAMAGNIKVLILSISSVVVFTVLMVTANTAAMAIRERVREIAVLKTLGFRRRMILALLLTESGGIALVGGLLGSLAARMVLQRIDSVWLSQGLHLRRLLVTEDTIGLALAIAVAIGLMSAAIPAYRATRITVAEALRVVV